jgi:indole-3-glycerol phosphate synthase
MNFLEELIAKKRERLSVGSALAGAGRESNPPVEGVGPERSAPASSLSSALLNGSGIIAEIKRRSPSRGALSPGLCVEDLARLYEREGASAISVITESEHFGGSLEDLCRARESVRAPLLRKDFLLSRHEVEETWRAGADALLLIAAVLTAAELGDLLQATTDLGMEALVEVHGEDELRTALGTGARLIGINNRDLTTLGVDLDTSRRLLPRIPSDCVAVVESGLRSREEIDEFRRLGAHGFLIGEALVTADNPAERLRELSEGTHVKDQGQDLRDHQSR